MRLKSYNTTTVEDCRRLKIEKGLLKKVALKLDLER